MSLRRGTSGGGEGGGALGGGRGSPAEAPPPPGPERTAPRAEAGSRGRKGTSPTGWDGEGAPDWMRVGGLKRAAARAGGRLSFAGGPAQPARGSEAESLRCGEGEEGARLLGRQRLRPTFLGGWRRSPKKCRRDPWDPSSIRCSSEVAASSSGRGQVLHGVLGTPPAGLHQLRGDPRPPPCSQSHPVGALQPAVCRSPHCPSVRVRAPVHL